MVFAIAVTLIVAGASALMVVAALRCHDPRVAWRMRIALQAPVVLFTLCTLGILGYSAFWAFAGSLIAGPRGGGLGAAVLRLPPEVAWGLSLVMTPLIAALIARSILARRMRRSPAFARPAAGQP